jgi:hypothetical protein
MPHSRFKRRIGFALAFALAIALMLPVTALGADKQPYQKSERSQTVYCSTSKTTPDGKTVKEDCTPDTNGPGNSSGGSSDPSSSSDWTMPDPGDGTPSGASSVTPDTMDSWLNGMMNGLFWAD